MIKVKISKIKYILLKTENYNTKREETYYTACTTLTSDVYIVDYFDMKLCMLPCVVSGLYTEKTNILFPFILNGI